MMYGQVKDVDLIPNGSLIAVTSHVSTYMPEIFTFVQHVVLLESS